MTNCYNTFFSQAEKGLSLRRHETNKMLVALDDLEHPDILLKKLLESQDSVARWHAEAAEKGMDGGKELGKIRSAIEIAGKIMSPLLSKETRSGGFANSGGNFLSALFDLWVQQDAFKAQHPRQAYIVQYDMVNMEAIMQASDRMISAADRLNPTRSARKRTTLAQFTDGYMRVINGLVRHEFEQKLIEKKICRTKESVAAYVHLIRPSNGDEYRLIVAGLGEDEIAEAMQAAQKQVEIFISTLGFDALAHMKYLKDNQPWHEIHTLESLQDPAIYKAFKYGGAGIKIGAVALGGGLSTDELLNALDQRINENREQRAIMREQRMQKALAENQCIFPSGHKTEAKSEELGTIRFNNPEAFKYIIANVRKAPYKNYYRRPEADRRDFPYDLTQERKFAYPANNPEFYIEKYIEIVKTYANLSDESAARLKKGLEASLTALPAATPCTNVAGRKAQLVAETIMDTIGALAADTMYGRDDHALMEIDSIKGVLMSHLATFLSTLNSYECFDITRKRILDKEAARLDLTDEQREILFYRPLAFFNSRDENGICLNGRPKAAVEMFQSCDHETRLLGYIGLSSFAGVNEISTSLGKSINEQIRSIAAKELKKRFGERVLDFAFVVDSGRLNLLVHGITKEQFVEALSAIEIRVENEINNMPLGELFKRYHTFSQPHLTRDVILALEDNAPQVEAMLDTVHRARAELGHVPLMFRRDNGGEIRFSPLAEDDMTPGVAEAVNAGKTIFLKDGVKDKAPIPAHVQAYLKANGYADVRDKHKLDLSRPLAILPNPKYTHEKGVRAITGYVELLGRQPSLANQSRNALAKLIEAKKRIPYEPGKGHLVQVPVESTPHYSIVPADSPVIVPQPVNPCRSIVQCNKMYPKKRPAIVASNPIDPAPAFVETPSNRSEWFQRLDQEEFSRLHMRQVPQTILQLITNPDVHVVKERDCHFKIIVNRSQSRYGRETPAERANFIKFALNNSHFGSGMLVTGLSADRNLGNKPISLHIAVSDKLADFPVNGTVRAGSAVSFMNDLVLFKARQATNTTESIPKDIRGNLQEKDTQYSSEVKAIRILRQYPTLQVTHDQRHHRFTFIVPPAFEGERQSVRENRAMKLFCELKHIFSEKAQQEELPVPAVSMSGQGSTRLKHTYEVRIKDTDVSRHVLRLMEELQYNPQIQHNSNGMKASGRY